MNLNCIKFLSLCCFIFGTAWQVYAQCEIENEYFQSGEVTEYDLYMKLGVLSTKGGYATMRTKTVTYDGKEAYKMSLTSSSQGMARKIFKLDDTLSCYMSKELVPLAYTKDAHEGGDYTRERLTYSYPGGGAVNVKAIRHKNGTFKFNESLDFKGCTYDLMSIVFYARTLDYAKMKNGMKVTLDFVSGKKKLNMQVLYGGAEKIKANNNVKYNCIRLALKIADDAFEDEKDAMTVYITDDANRMIVRMDSKLNFGSTKAILKSYKGNRYPVGTKK
ncbi:DUF3108 domain-containing protein [Viscerimonas tarda]